MLVTWSASSRESKPFDDIKIEAHIRNKIHKEAKDWHLIEAVIFFIDIEWKLREYENKCTYLEVLVVER